MLTMLVLSHIGLALLVMGFLALLVTAARVRWWWGVLALLPPCQWLFVLLHRGKGWQALLAQVLGVGIIILPAMDMVSDPVLATHYANQRYSLQCCDFSQPLVVAAPLPEDPEHPLIRLENLLTPQKLEEIETKVRAAVRSEQTVAPVATPEAPAPSVQEPEKPIYKCKDERGRVSYTEKPCDEKAEAMHDLPAVNQQPPVTVTEHYRAEPPVETYEEKTSVQRNGRFQCDGRTRCSQMTSCEEAKFFLAHCPDVKMDGGGDGVPCESQWCGEDGE